MKDSVGLGKVKKMKIGLDVGSTTLKCVVLDEKENIVYQEYERHFSRITEKASGMLYRIAEQFPQTPRMQIAVSGSAGMGLAESLGLPFVQEVYATRVAVNRLLPGTDVVIELGGEDEDIIRDGEKIRDELLKCVYGVWDHLKNVGNHGVENLDLDWVGFVPGYRESRRIEGDYLLNEKDVLANRIFPDAVAYGGWQMDQHVRRGLLDTDKIPSQILNFNGCYTIPWRCYYAKDLENVMLAGRDISTTKMAFGSTRVMGTCAVGGQAVGTAAAMAVRYGCTPRQIGEHMEELQQELLRDDCYIPGYRNTDPQDLARTAQISATSAREGFTPEKVINGVSRDENGIRNMWSSDGISPEGETLTLKLASVKKVSQVRLTFDSNFNYPIKITLSKKRQLQQRIGVPPELVKDYTVTLWRGEQKMAEQKVTENDQRQNVVTFEPTECDKVTITIHTTNGEKDVHIYEVRVYS